MSTSPSVIDQSFMKTAKQTAAIYLYHLRQYPLQLTVVLIMLPFAVVIMAVMSPLIAAALIDRIASNTLQPGVSVWQEFGPFIWLYVINNLAGNVIWRVNGYIFSDFLTKSLRDVESRVFNWLSGHSYAFYSNAFSGALVAQNKRFVSSFERIVEMLYFDVLRTVILVVASIIVVSLHVPLIGLIMFIWAVVFTSLSLYMNVKKSKYSRIFAAADSAVTARLADVITNVLTVKVFSSIKPEQATFSKRIEDKRLKLRKVFWLNESIFAVQGLLINASYLGMWALTLGFLVNGTIGIGTVLLIWLYWSQLLRELFFVGRFVGRIEFALSDAAEMTKILHSPHEVTDPAEPEELAITDGEISFKNVQFAYQDDSNTLFKKLNLHIPAGQKVGLVGPSGGGKTTITKLLLRFTDIQGGEITIDNQNIAKLRQDDARSVISYVPQEPLLFHRSLAENIGYSQEKPDIKEIKQAAKLARASDFIGKLDEGYDTLVGERGIKLSGGEKQRVAIARAILKKAPILVLDEATSALDSESERLIQESLDDLMQDKTAIVIAHRLSTIQKLDRIIVVNAGKIVEDGTHKQLLAKKGLYSDLWSHQTGGFIED